MIAAFAVLGLVVDDAVFNLNFADAEVALEVGHVVVGVPQAEFHVGEQRQIGGDLAAIGDGQLPDFQVFAGWDEVAGAGVDALVG